MTPNPTKTCTIRSAVSGVCGKPAVYSFESKLYPGEIFSECAEHYDPRYHQHREVEAPKRQTKFNVRGHMVRSLSQRRFIVVYVTPSSAKVVRRSDSAKTAIKAAEGYGYRIRNTHHTYAVVIDTTDGSEV